MSIFVMLIRLSVKALRQPKSFETAEGPHTALDLKPHP